MRTIEDFVTEAICKGRTKEEVRCIALSTRWHDVTAIVLATYDRLCKPSEKKEVA